MTLEEANQFAAFLTRVWVSSRLRSTIEWEYDDNRETQGTLYPHEPWFSFKATVFKSMVDTAFLEVLKGDDGKVMFSLRRSTEGTRLSTDTQSGDIEWFYDVREKWDKDGAKFEQRWRNVFRRNCFLCGVPIEASAHEKIEWGKWLEEKPAD